MIDIYLLLLLLLVRSSMDALGPSLMKYTVLGAKPNNCLRVLGRTVLCNTVQYCTVMFACEILLPQSCCYSFARTASSCVRGLLNRTSCLLVYHRRVHITHFMTWITVIDGLQSSRMKYSQFPCAVLVLSCHWPSISEWSNANALQSSIFTYLPLSLFDLNNFFGILSQSSSTKLKRVPIKFLQCQFIGIVLYSVISYLCARGVCLISNDIFPRSRRTEL